MYAGLGELVFVSGAWGNTGNPHFPLATYWVTVWLMCDLGASVLTSIREGRLNAVAIQFNGNVNTLASPDEYTSTILWFSSVRLLCEALWVNQGAALTCQSPADGMFLHVTVTKPSGCKSAPAATAEICHLLALWAIDDLLTLYQVATSLKLLYNCTINST